MRIHKNIRKFRHYQFDGQKTTNYQFDGLEKLLKTKSKPIDKRSILI